MLNVHYFHEEMGFYEFFFVADDGLKIALGERFGFRVNAPGKQVTNNF